MDDIKQSTTSNKGGTNGSVAGVTSSDLEQGFITDTTDTMNGDDTVEATATFDERQGGFLGRPHGWER